MRAGRRAAPRRRGRRIARRARGGHPSRARHGTDGHGGARDVVVMTPEDKAVVAAALSQVPQLADYATSAEQLEVTRLGGLTNLVYKVVLPEGHRRNGGDALCLRCPGEVSSQRGQGKARMQTTLADPS